MMIFIFTPSIYIPITSFRDQFRTAISSERELLSSNLGVVGIAPVISRRGGGCQSPLSPLLWTPPQKRTALIFHLFPRRARPLSGSVGHNNGVAPAERSYLTNNPVRPPLAWQVGPFHSNPRESAVGSLLLLPENAISEDHQNPLDSDTVWTLLVVYNI